LVGSCAAGFAAVGVAGLAAGGAGGSGGVGAVGPAGAAAVAADSAVVDELPESQSAADVWRGLLQARHVSSIQPRADERWVVMEPGRPADPDSA